MASVFKRGGKKAKGYWYASWFDYLGKRRSKCTRTTDKATAERIAAKHEANAALRREGVIDATLDAIGQQSQRTIESHLVDYEAKLRLKNSGEHATETLAKIRKICAEAKFVLASDIAADRVTVFANNWQEGGASVRSAQAYVVAIKGFTRWLAEHHKLPFNPLSSVQTKDPKANRRRERRMLLPAEWAWLRDATNTGTEYRGISGRERALLYATAIQTGLRSNELRQLTRGRFYLESEKPYVICKAGTAKNKKEAKQYILAELAGQLKDHIALKAPQSPVFQMPHETDVVRQLRADLAQARRNWLEAAKSDPAERLRREESDFLCETNHGGERLDFHSLRHTCGAWLSMKGEHPKVVQTVMRHQSITLTMDTYGHLFPGQTADAICRVGEFFESPKCPLRATGTDGKAAEKAQRQAQHLRRETVPLDATASDALTASLGFVTSLNLLDVAKLDDAVQDGAVTCLNSGAGIRTPDTRIMIPLL